jgi:hypothetical protein
MTICLLNALLSLEYVILNFKARTKSNHYKIINKGIMPSVEGDECMSDISEQKFLIELFDTSFGNKDDEMQMSSIDENESFSFESPKKGIPREIFAAGDGVLKMAVDSPLSQVKEECNRLDGSPCIIDLTNPDIDDPLISIKDSDGVTVAVVVESKMARLAAENCVLICTLFRVLKHTKFMMTTLKNTSPLWTKQEKLRE